MKQTSSALFDRDTLLHLRLPFSLFLLPVFCFGISQAEQINITGTIIIFIVLHFFIYPGSNIYNSFMDEDKGSIGGLKNPPPVTKKLFYVSIIFDSTGLLLCLLINFRMFFLMLVYTGISKAYSWKKIRLKKHAYSGWLVVMLFQGGYTFLLVNMAASDIFSRLWFSDKNIAGFILSSLLIGASYPLTQIYQHEEDSERGDYTISYKLGIRGTFVFTSLMFFIACLTAFIYFNKFYSAGEFLIFIICLMPVIAYFLYWFIRSWKDRLYADYIHAMRMTTISSLCMIICFTVLFSINHF